MRTGCEATGSHALQLCQCHRLSGIRSIPQGNHALSNVKKAIQQTIVARRSEEVRDERHEQEDRAWDKTGSTCDNFHALTVRRPSQRQKKVSTSRTRGTRRMAKRCARPERQGSMRQTSRTFHKECHKSCESVQPNRSTAHQELKNVTTCKRCGALGH